MTTQQQPYIPLNDPALPSSGTPVPAVLANGNVYITNINEYTTIRVSGPAEPAGNTSEVQFNRSGTMSADDGLTYNPTTDSLTVNGNLTAGYVLTNSLKYANGANWEFGSGYSNTNVFAYLPTYVGNLNPNIVSATLFAGSGANLTNLPAGNLVGSVPVAAVANSVAGANVTGTVSKATIADTANAVAGSNVSGTVSSATSATTATFAGTVTTAAQPNITSVGTLNGLTSTGTINLTGASNVSLGPIGNVKITGGTNGQVLAATSTNGVLQWTTPTAGNLQDITTNGANTDRAINISNTTVSTAYNNGALKVAGGVGIGGDVHINGQLAANGTVYAGHLADFGSWVNPVIVGRDTGSDYIQGALVNINPNGSADWVAYNDRSDEDGGASAWTDMGYTGSTFSDPLYTITEANDGYLFVQGKVGASGGNLVLATGEKGAHKDLVFATGGFLSNNESMRLDHERDIFFIGGHAHAGLSDRVIDVDINGNVTVDGNITFGDTSTQSTAFTTAKNDKLANAIVWTTAPVGNDSTGTAGQVAYDAGGNLFVCVATDTWAKFTGSLGW